MSEEQPFLTTKLINCGSYYEGTKVGKPDEFDFYVELDRLSSPENVKVQELPCSTVAVIPTESALKQLKLCFKYGHEFEWERSIN